MAINHIVVVVVCEEDNEYFQKYLYRSKKKTYFPFFLPLHLSTILQHEFASSHVTPYPTMCCNGNSNLFRFESQRLIEVYQSRLRSLVHIQKYILQ